MKLCSMAVGAFTSLVLVLAGAAGTAHAATRSIVDFDMRQTVSTYPGQNIATSAYPNNQQYRWVDSPSAPSRISANLCSNYDVYTSADFGTGEVSYRQIGGPYSPGACFVLRGRSLGASFFSRDGNLLY